MRGASPAWRSESVKCPAWGVRRPATVKLKGIDGGPHKRRNMWFNSMIREEPYPGSNAGAQGPRGPAPRGGSGEVLHGCRQLVP